MGCSTHDSDAVPAGDLPLVQRVQEAFDGLDEAVASLEHLVPGFALIRRPVKKLHWPDPGPPKAGGRAGRTLPPVTEYPPARVLEAWRTGGPRWLARASRREVRAAQLALSDDGVGPELVRDSRFLEGLVARLRATAQQRVLATALFRVFPPLQSVQTVLASVPAVPGSPAWWSSCDSLQSMLHLLSGAVLAGDLSAPGDLGVPGPAWRNGWAEAVVAERPPRSTSEVRAQLRFARSGQEPTVGVLRQAVITALRAGIELASRGSSNRREIARLAAQHAGSPFGPDAEARWRPLGNGLRLVRQWLAGEIIKIVFQHLVPPDPSLAHMAPPRRRFWSRYTGSVRRIWVAVTPAIRPQLKHPDVVRLDETMGQDFVICDLEGGPEQAVVWMQLDGPRGPVTVIEGNANTSIRIRAGALSPPPLPAWRRFGRRRLEVHYKSDITQGPFARGESAGVIPHDQWRRWEGKTTSLLLKLGVGKDDL